MLWFLRYLFNITNSLTINTVLQEKLKKKKNTKKQNSVELIPTGINSKTKTYKLDCVKNTEKNLVLYTLS